MGAQLKFEGYEWYEESIVTWFPKSFKDSKSSGCSKYKDAERVLTALRIMLGSKGSEGSELAKSQRINGSCGD